jgi:toxin ParE1/3/4
MRRIEVDHEAYAEAEAAMIWYAENARPGTSARFFEEINVVIEALASDAVPRMWVSGSAGVMRALLKSFPYQVLYVEEDSVTRVFAICHLKRRPGYWKSRQPKH